MRGRDTERSDEELAAAAAGGDGEAFGELFRRHRDGTYAFCVRLVGPGSAPDALQEGWLRIWRSRATYEDGRPFVPWAYRIMRNICIDMLRRRKGTIPLEVEAGGEDVSVLEFIPASGPSPGEKVAADEAVRKVYEALGRLPLAQREAVALRLVEGASYEEIARVAGCSVGTVKSRLHYGLERLRGELGSLLEEWREVL